MATEQQDAFQEIYEGYGRADLAQAGKAYLQGHLKLRARRHGRWFWIGFTLAVVIAVWLTVLGIVYLLERTRATADGFERHRRERMDRLESGAGE